MMRTTEITSLRKIGTGHRGLGSKSVVYICERRNVKYSKG